MNKYEYICRVDDLGVTVIENTFINHYLPNANGDYVKVYLYALKCAGYSKNVAMTDAQLASSLSLTEQDVINAWKYWQDEKVISVVNSHEGKIVRFENLASIFFGGKEIPAEEPGISVSPSVEGMFDDIESKIARPLVHSERDCILSWTEEYNLSPQAIVLIVEDSLKRGVRKINYWEAIARDFHNNGITTYDQAWDYFEKRDNRRNEYREILHYMGLYHNPTEPEKALMGKWLDDYKLDMDTIKKAADRTAGANNPSIKYLDTVIEGIVNGDETTKSDAKQKKNNRIVTGNEHGYDYDELEKLLIADFSEFDDENFED